jgi:hypothetical protein
MVGLEPEMVTGGWDEGCPLTVDTKGECLSVYLVTHACLYLIFHYSSLVFLNIVINLILTLEPRQKSM